LIGSTRKFFLINDFIRRSDCTDKQWDDFWLERSKIGPCITALLQLDSSHKDCLVARKLTRTRAAQARQQNTSMKLRFLWQSFQHHIYIYTEKIGLLQKCLSELPYVQNLSTSHFDVSVFRKRALSRFKPIHRIRGQIVHEWTVDHQSINILAMIEVLALDEGNHELPTPVHDVENHAKDAAYSIRQEMLEWESKLLELNDEIISRGCAFVDCHVKEFNKRYADLISINEDGETALLNVPKGEAPSLWRAVTTN
jgi:hypothetical protein